MPQFEYKLVDRRGDIVKGVVDASSLERARILVQMDGCYIVGLKEQGVLNKDIDLSKVTTKDLGALCSQIASILNAGVPVAEAVEMSSRAIKNTKLKTALDAVNERINTGVALSIALSEHSKIFPNLMVQMVKAGEESGSLSEVFERLENQFKKQSELANQIKKATSYPKMVLIIILLAMVVVCGYVVPMFVDIFDDMGTELPWSTKVFIAISDLITKKWWLLLGITVVVIAGWTVFKSSKKGKRIIDIAKTKIPLIKNLTIKTNSADFSRTLSTLLLSGMDYNGALQIAKDTMTNSVYKDAVTQIHKDVVNGISFADALIKTHMFPDMMETLSKIGEETGDVPKMLNNAADYFEDEVQTATLQLTSAINPIIIIFMGVFVGLLVYSIYSPMFSMYSGIAG